MPICAARSKNTGQRNDKVSFGLGHFPLTSNFIFGILPLNRGHWELITVSI